MRILHRYVTFELVGSFHVVLVLLTLLLMLVVVGQEAMRMNLGIGPTLRLIPFATPTALAFSVPAALLFAVCLVYGRMSADNEVVAAKALGIWPVQLLWPAWILAAGLSLVGIWLNDLANSWGTVGIQRVVIQSLEEVAYRMLRTQRSFANSRFSIIVKEVQGHRLIQPFMTFQPNNDLPALRITAAEAELHSDLSRDVMRLVLTDFEIEIAPDVRTVLPGREVREVPLAYFSARDLRSGSPAQLPLRAIAGETVEQQRRIRELEQSLAARTALALVTGELEELSEENWKKYRKQLTDAQARLFRLRTEPWRRTANGLGALFFTLVGAPLAILLKKADVVSRFGIAFGAILVAYYPLFLGCCDLAKTGTMPPYIVWLPNVLLAVAAVWLTKRVIRY